MSTSIRVKLINTTARRLLVVSEDERCTLVLDPLTAKDLNEALEIAAALPPIEESEGI